MFSEGATLSMMTATGWAVLLFISLVVVGVFLLLRFEDVFMGVPLRPLFFGSIYFLSGITFASLILAFLKYVISSMAEPYVLFVVAIAVFLFLAAWCSILSGLVLLFHGIRLLITGKKY